MAVCVLGGSCFSVFWCGSLPNYPIVVHGEGEEEEEDKAH